MLNFSIPLFLSSSIISNTLYYVICFVLAGLVMFGIFLMSKVEKARMGNLISALAILIGVIITLVRQEILGEWAIYLSLVIGAGIGYILSIRIKMIQMPQMIAMLNGLGGLASLIVGAFALIGIGADPTQVFSQIVAGLAVAIGAITFFGSLVAAGKLHRVLPQKAITLPGHKYILAGLLIFTFLGIVLPFALNLQAIYVIIFLLVLASSFGVVFTIKIGGADMPIVISLLNSLSGVAGAISGLAIGDPLLVSIGGIVGASGLLLTQIMCKAMNRRLFDILLGRKSLTSKAKNVEQKNFDSAEELLEVDKPLNDPIKVLKNAKSVIIVPGYGMAIAQAQHLVKQLADLLVEQGAEVRYAIHPVAGRMPGHMNVLLAEADVDYDDLYEMDDLNSEFGNVDCAIVIGANDVLNPAARQAEGTPIYGMPILNVDECKEVFIFNFDLSPGYSGVENPLYKKKEGIHLYLGNASDTLKDILTDLTLAEQTIEAENEPIKEVKSSADPIGILKAAKSVIIVPGYGMAIAQAQHLVKQLGDFFVEQGSEVRYAIHPVAGRMPGHMNVLLAEADVDYDDLYEMDDLNSEFGNVDCAIVIGANDVLNPAARQAEGTPIYGMPILNVDQCKEVFIFNYDLSPGYSGVENPLYQNRKGVHLFLGNAADTLKDVLADLRK